MSFKKPHRRRRGARKSERKNKLTVNVNVANEASNCESNDLQTPATATLSPEDTSTTTVSVEQTENIPDSHEWELVPTEIEADPESGWETLKVKKSFKKPSLSNSHTPKESRDSTPVQSNRVKAQEVPPAGSEVKAQEVAQAGPESDVVSEVTPETQIDDSSNSAPASRKSTLKRPKKKRSSVDSSGENRSVSSLSKPVLISDRDFDVASAAAQRRYHSAFEVLDEEKIKEVASSKKGQFDTLYISDIGHGMGGGPITLGRFGLGKYVPPDRSNEIYPIPMQKNEDETEKSEASEEADEGSEKSQEAQKSIIRAMMQEVIKNNAMPQNAMPAASNAGLTYIRDAERFTEITPKQQCLNEESKSVPIPDAIISKHKTQELDLD